MAVWSMYRALGDGGGSWLADTAWPLLSGIAEFWMSKLALDNPGAPPGAPLSLNNVIPPDEYADHVNNSAYTNHGAIQTLAYAAAVARLTGLPAPVEAWEDAASRIVRPHNASGAPGGWTPEFAGYDGRKIKQADVILLGFPLEADWVPAQTRANNLLRYQNATAAGGPAMTWGMFSAGYVELGEGFESAAAANLNRSFANAQAPFLVWTETPTGGAPNFLTGAGGFLQTAFQGYTGLRLNDTALALRPQLPEGAGTIKLRGFAYRGRRLDIFYNATTLVVEQVPEAAGGGGVSGAGASACALCMAPAGAPPAARSQWGRVVMGGGAWRVAPAALAVVDAEGVSHALADGAPVALPRQAVGVVAV